MNDKEKQIAEMAVIGCVRNPKAHIVEECMKCEFKDGSCNAYRHAEYLYSAGYRKQSDTAREILQYLYEKMGNVSLSDTELVLYLAAQYGVEVEV